MTAEERKEYHREYYQNHKKYFYESSKFYYRAHRAEILAKQKERRERNQEALHGRQDWISKLRQSKGLSQRQLAEMLGVSRGTLAHYEHGFAIAPEEKIREVLERV